MSYCICPDCGSRIIRDKCWDDDQEVHLICSNPNCDFGTFDGECTLEETEDETF